MSIIALQWAAALVGLGACLAGLGSLLSGIAALRVAKKEGKDEGAAAGS